MSLDVDESLSLLRGGREGIKQWNCRRDRGRGEQIPELHRVDLRSADLQYADLRSVDLAGSDLCGANLSHATLQAAKLGSANLQRTTFHHAYLEETYFGFADAQWADFSDACLVGTYFGNSNLQHAIFDRVQGNSHTSFISAELTNARFSGASLHGAYFGFAKLDGCSLTAAQLDCTYFGHTSLRAVDFQDSSLEHSVFVDANLEGANLANCSVYGVSAWDVQLDGARQSNLVISKRHTEPTITVDNLEVAQFIYLLLNNERIRAIIDTITSKVVLILGRFTPRRKAILDSIRDELRDRNYCPVVFDFETPAARDTHETVTTLARMSRFIIADLTDPKCLPQELVSIVESLPSVPVQPLIEKGSRPWGMYDHIKRYPWVFDIFEYERENYSLASLVDQIIDSPQLKLAERKT